MVAHFTSYENRWRFKVDAREYMLQKFMWHCIEHPTVIDNRKRDLYELMKQYGMKVIEKNKKKLEYIEKYSNK